MKPASAAELQAFLARYDGTVVRDDTVPQPPADFGITLSEEERAPTSYLVRLDLDQTNVENVNANAAAAGLTGVLEFSSENGLRTFAGLMDARVQGFRVSGNFVYQGHQCFRVPCCEPRSGSSRSRRRAATPMPTPVFNDALSTAAYNDYGDDREPLDREGGVAVHRRARHRAAGTRVAIIDGGFWLDAQGSRARCRQRLPGAAARARAIRRRLQRRHRRRLERQLLRRQPLLLARHRLGRGGDGYRQQPARRRWRGRAGRRSRFCCA